MKLRLSVLFPATTSGTLNAHRLLGWWLGMNPTLLSPSKDSLPRANRPANYIATWVIGLLFVLGASALTMAQTASISFPYQRQSFSYGTQIPITPSINSLPGGVTVTQVDAFTSTGGTSATVLIGLSTTSPYTVTWPVYVQKHSGLRRTHSDCRQKLD